MKKTDVKEKLAEKVDLALEEKEELVAVEMTPEQRDKFVKIMADEKVAKQAEEERGAYEMDLGFSHWINGVKYGPGRKVRVPEGLQGRLVVQENNWRNHEMNLMASHTKQFQIFQDGTRVPVKVK